MATDSGLGDDAAARDRAVLLSTLPASSRQRRVALGVSLLLVAAFVATVPFAQVPGPRIPGFIVAQESILLVNDLITAVLLFGQYTIQRSRRLAILASGYLFTALIVIPHALMFPGAFSETGLVAATPQSSSWLYIVWHTVFPFALIAYALDADPSEHPDGLYAGSKAGILAAVTAGGATLFFALLATVAWLPALIDSGRFTPVAQVAVGAVLVVSLTALIVVARRRPRSVLDVWLMVVMLAWLCAITVGSWLSSGRYDAGWYAGRLYATLASLLVLAVLLFETVTLYARVVRAAAIERQQRERRVKELEALLAHAGRVTEVGQMVSSLAHEVSQPLAALSNYLGASLQLAKDPTPANAAKIQRNLERSAEQTNRATNLISHLKDFIAKRETEKKITSVSDTLRDAVRLGLVGAGPRAPRVEIDCAPAASFALFDRIQIEQVVFNLVRNAIEAMATSSRRALRVSAAASGEDMVEVKVADSGPGLPPEVRTKLFEPFVTTKVTGLGVGLSICRLIVEAHGGQLEASDGPDGGTVFRFTLPRQPPAMPVAE